MISPVPVSRIGSEVRPEHADHFVVGGVHVLLGRDQHAVRNRNTMPPPTRPAASRDQQPEREPDCAEARDQKAGAPEPSKKRRQGDEVEGRDGASACAPLAALASVVGACAPPDVRRRHGRTAVGKCGRCTCSAGRRRRMKPRSAEIQRRNRSDKNRTTSQVSPPCQATSLESRAKITVCGAPALSITHACVSPAYPPALAPRTVGRRGRACLEFRRATESRGACRFRGPP